MSDFAKVPHWILPHVAAGTLNASSLVVLVAIAKHVNYRTGRGGWPSNATLQKETGLSERTVRRALNELESIGAVVTVERFNHRGRQTTNLVEIVADEPGHQWPPPVTDDPPRSPVAGGRNSNQTSYPNIQPQPEVETGHGWPPYEREVSTYSPSRDTSSSVVVHEDQVFADEKSSPTDVVSPSVTRDDDGIAKFPTVAARLLGLDDDPPKPWVAAWTAGWATYSTSKVDHDLTPEEHLIGFIVKCREARHDPRPSIWLKWYFEDRAKHHTALDVARESAERNEEHPQDREDRYNRRLPPADWGVIDNDGKDQK